MDNIISTLLKIFESILTQSIFDNHLKNNFYGRFFYTSENRTLDLLREKVITYWIDFYIFF